MADEVKINPSPPPAEPFDVPTNPSPPPSEPFDVKVYPDPPPGGTSDVPTSPDGPPAKPHDVSTSPDGPPVKPIDVTTLPSVPSPAPHDVPISLDGPPIVPVDVPTLPDSGPAAPFDVQTSLDGPPIEPNDVTITLDGPPVDTIDVATTPDQSPAAPIDVGIFLSPPPAEPIDIRDHRELGVPALPYPFSPKPTTRELVHALKDIDSRLSSFIKSLDENASIGIAGAGGGALDPTILAAWFRDYLNTVGPSGVAKFIAEQSILYAMNPVVARIFDPLYFVKMMVPGSMGHMRTTADTMAGNTAKTVAEARDVVLTNRIRSQSGKPGGNGFSDRPDVYGPENTMRNGQDFSVDEMVEAAIDGDDHPFMSPAGNMAGLVPVKKFDSAKYFEDRRPDGTMPVRSLAKTRAATGAENIESRKAALVASNFINGIVRVPIGPNEDADGCVYSQTPNPSGPIVDDDDARVPVSFTDLRKTSRGYRSVYVRPLNLGFSKSISPEWSEASAFGRVDPIVGYQRTTRSYSVSFDMQAFAPEDLEVMYRKMTWLDSMCYPSYGDDSLMKSGPVIRMRIGDAVSTDSGGLSGIIKSLNTDFTEVMWELKKGMKVPMSFKVTLEFLALHDGPVGRLNDDFGVFQLPQSRKEDVDTSVNGPPAESRDGPPRTATYMPGRYARFGDPSRK